MAFVTAVFLLAGLAGCGGKLSDDFKEEEVKTAAQEIVTKVNEGNLEDVYENSFSVVLQNGIEMEDLQENLDYVLEKAGEFESFEKTEVRGVKDKDTGTEYATAMVLVKYKDGKAMFTISFDTDMKCAGFFIK